MATNGTHEGGATKLTRKAEQAIAALLEHPTIDEAAKACGVSKRSLWRWLQRPDFQKRYREAQRAVVDAAVTKLQAATVRAVETLERNLSCGNFFAENAAAQAILAHAFKAIEMRELQEQIDEIKTLIEARGKHEPRRTA
ncbi:MAG: transposase family protein [Acidobacteriota bacterium]|nr:transposase family protein [Acidobacteriota bacterium]